MSDVKEDPILTVRGVSQWYPITGSGLFGKSIGHVKAVTSVDLDLYSGQTLSIVGESGCGKSSLVRTLLRLEKPTAGTAMFRGEDVFGMDPRRLREFRRQVQMVFQDPYGSLNPRKSVFDIVSESWKIHRGLVPREKRSERVGQLLEQVGLNPDHTHRYPHEFSGGQRQRIGIARALAVEPDVLICDEPVSALDVSVQAQVINLLEDLQRELDLAYLVIAHDLSVVQHMSDHVAVMYLGEIVEHGPADELYERATHPYTQALLSASPKVLASGGESGRIILAGELPSPSDVPPGCTFQTRCWKAEEKCVAESPELIDRLGVGHPSTCHFPEELASIGN